MSLLPKHIRIYAIGDIHGRVDLLKKLHARISKDAKKHPADQCTIIYLGDYIDRGPHSKEVIAEFLHSPLKNFKPIHILGNHEALLLDFLKNPENGELWLMNGGLETLMSYEVTTAFAGTPTFKSLCTEFLKKLPTEHLTFFKSLVLSHSVGHYFFCHGGVNPAIPLDQQTEADLTWIREPFLNSTKDFGKIVVHGHSFSRKPEVKSNRIGIDTGAVFTECLTCVVLTHNQHYFLQTI